MRITWRAALISLVAGSLSLLRVTVGDALVAGQGAAQRRFDPLGEGGEIRLAVERDIDRAAHQGRAAKAGQDCAGKPLDRDAPAIDEARGCALDKQWRIVAEIDRLRGWSQTIWIAPLPLIQAPCPLRSPPRPLCPRQSHPRLPKAQSNGTPTRCRAPSGPSTRLPEASLDSYCDHRPFPNANNAGGMWRQCGAGG